MLTGKVAPQTNKVNLPGDGKRSGMDAGAP